MILQTGPESILDFLKVPLSLFGLLELEQLPYKRHVLDPHSLDDPVNSDQVLHLQLLRVVWNPLYRQDSGLNVELLQELRPDLQLRVLDLLRQEVDVKRFRLQAVQKHSLSVVVPQLPELQPHPQVLTHILHSVEHHAGNPQSVKRPEHVIALTRHCNQAELVELLEVQLVRNPHTNVSYRQYGHDVDYPPQKK